MSDQMAEQKLKAGDKIEIRVQGTHGGYFIRHGTVIYVIEKEGRVSVKYKFVKEDFYAPPKEGKEVSSFTWPKERISKSRIEAVKRCNRKEQYEQPDA